jgi:quercetin dioxygenase-like cupin family protein
MGHLYKFDELPSVARGAGIASVELTAPPLEGQGFIMGITTFPPGTSIPIHCHNTTEQVTLIEGEGIAEIDGDQFPVRTFDTTQVPAGQFHRFLNPGTSTMRILWVYGSTHVTRTFEDGRTVEQFEQA